MAALAWKTSRPLAVLLGGAALLALPGAAMAQARMDHDITQNGGRDREAGPRGGWGGGSGMGRSRGEGMPDAPRGEGWRRPAQSWSQPAPVPQPAPAAAPMPPRAPAYAEGPRDRAPGGDGRGIGAPRQQGWDGQRWNGQNWNGQTWNRDGRPPQTEGPRPQGGGWSGDRRADGNRQWQGERQGNGDRGWNGDRSWNRDRNWNGDRSWDRDRRPDWNTRRESWSSRGDRDWNRQWRQDRRYDWRTWRSDHREVYRLGRYTPPYRSYAYRRLGIGFFLDGGFFGASYWINDPWMYRLPPAYGPYRWVRYYDDALMVNIYSGEVVDVIYDFFW
ncbi:MAG: RcnB family protein [Sphingomonadales bacterium]|nr:RcnB family protein [Sphingomonadales bacterium]